MKRYTVLAGIFCVALAGCETPSGEASSGDEQKPVAQAASPESGEEFAEAPREYAHDEPGAAALPPMDAPDDRPLAEIVNQAWAELQVVGHRCDTFDYFPNGGMYTVYCRLKNFGSFSQLETALGIPVFRSGPHQGGRLDRTSETEFGHYNPEFVQGLAEWALPDEEGENFHLIAEATYDYALADLARVYWATYQKLKSEPDFWRAQQEELKAHMAAGEVPFDFYEKFFFFMNPHFMERPDGDFDFFHSRGFDGDHNGNVVKTAVGFWIRRGIDATADEFAGQLEVVMLRFDEEFVSGKPKDVSSK